MEQNNIKKGYAFDEKKHAHTYDGKPMYGVTTVLGVVSKGDGLIQWSANEAVKWLQEHPTDFEGAKKAWVKTRNTAGNSGVDTHAIVENLIRVAIETNDGYIESGIEGYQDNQQIINFLSWAFSNKIKFIHTELNTYSLDWWVGGIVDFVYEKDGKIYIGDIKTAKAIYPINFIQTSAYGKMLIENKIIDRVDGMTIVLLSKDGTFQVQENYDFDGNVKCFESCLFMYKHLEAIK